MNIEKFQPKTEQGTQEKDKNNDLETGFDKELKNSLDNYLEKYGEDLPPVSIQFHFGPHLTEADANDIKAKLKESDVYIPEYLGWSQKVMDEYNEISQGKRSNDAEEKDRSEGKLVWGFRNEIFNNLYKRKKFIILIDLNEIDY